RDHSAGAVVSSRRCGRAWAIGGAFPLNASRVRARRTSGCRREPSRGAPSRTAHARRERGALRAWRWNNSVFGARALGITNRNRSVWAGGAEREHVNPVLDWSISSKREALKDLPLPAAKSFWIL